MEYIFSPGEYEDCKKISWSDVIEKIDVESSRFEHRLVCTKRTVPTIVLHSNYYPGTIKAAYDEVANKKNISILHIYASFGRTALTFGRHCDTVDVLLVQSIGKMTYMFDDTNSVDLYPGDSLFIPKGVYHNPIVSEPRVTLSFSWE